MATTDTSRLPFPGPQFDAAQCDFDQSQMGIWMAPGMFPADGIACSLTWCMMHYRALTELRFGRKLPLNVS
jgi:hypothetical protein